MKTKKLFLVLSMIVPFGMAITGCATNNNASEHSWKNSWAWDADSHWKQCTDCNATGFKNAHIWSEAANNTFSCMCGAIKKADGTVDVNNGNGESAPAYDNVSDVTKLNRVYIVASNGGTYAAMTNEEKSDKLPWYMNSVSTDVSSTKKGADIKGDAALFEFKKQADGTYTIQDAGGEYLYCYIDGTHYSIGISATVPSNGCKFWNLTQEGNKFILKGASIDVFLGYSEQGSFCGNKEAPADGIYFFVKGTGTGTGEGNNNGTGGGTIISTGAAAYDLVSDESKINAVYIVSSSSGTYAAMTNEQKSDKLPWYFNSIATDVSSTKAGADIQGTAALFTFAKQADGSYTIKDADGKYLYCYIDGTHYSIGILATVPSNGCQYWTLTKDGNKFILKGKTIDVYLGYSDQGSFCGKKEAPADGIYFYVKGTGTGTGETISGGNGGGGTVVVSTDTKWNVDFTQYGTTFRDTLATLINGKQSKTASYDSCLSIGKAAAANGAGKYTPFYHGSDYTYTTGGGSNREHTWPNSRGGGDKRGGANIEKDPFMVRPTITADNSDRSNYFYGTNGKNEWDPASCGFEAARGESARVIFYVATKYGKSNGLSLSNNPGDSSSKKTMGTLKLLVQWNKKYPVTDMEKQINEYLFKEGYGRNPFVDHPEYVDFIWNESGVVTSAPKIENNSAAAINATSSVDSAYDYSLMSAIKDIEDAASYLGM